MTEVIERAQRMAEIARERERPRHDHWNVVKADGEHIELILTEPQDFDWVAARYPGAGIKRA
jgi:hypothetical protein